MERPRDYFYVMKFSRSWGRDKHCMPMPREGGISIGDDEELRFIARAYLRPGTVVGPDYKTLIKPRVIRFRPK